MLRLFHISEDENINVFLPRESKKQWNNEKYVWAVSSKRIHNYLVPRECPRICIAPDKQEVLSNWTEKENTQDKKAVIFIPNTWKKEIEKCTLFRYEFSTSNFHEIDKIAGYFVSKSVEIPLKKIAIRNCPEVLRLLKVGVIFTDKPSLEMIKENVVRHLTDFSIIKWDNL